VNIKKICLILALILSPAICFGAEALNINLGNAYLITTEYPTNASVVANPAILTINPFFTIFNEKNILLIHPEKVGKTLLTLFQTDKNIILDISVTAKESSKCFKPLKKDGFEVTLLDEPPVIENYENYEFDAPPVEMEGNK